MDKEEAIAFKFISLMGMARSHYLCAIDAAESGIKEKYLDEMKKGDRCYKEGHRVHAELLTEIANGVKIEPHLLLIHAEDLLMSAETFSIMAKKFIALYNRIS